MNLEPISNMYTNTWLPRKSCGPLLLCAGSTTFARTPCYMQWKRGIDDEIFPEQTNTSTKWDTAAGISQTLNIFVGFRRITRLLDRTSKGIGVTSSRCSVLVLRTFSG